MQAKAPNTIISIAPATMATTHRAIVSNIATPWTATIEILPGLEVIKAEFL